MEALIAKTQTILREHGYHKVCYPLEDLARRLEEAQFMVVRKISFYKPTSFVVLTAIPVISTIVSILSTKRIDGVPLDSLAYSLTFLTLYNSIFKPSFRFQALCEMGISIENLQDDFLAALEALPEVEEGKLHAIQKQYEGRLHAIRHAYETRLLPHERRLISFFLPAEGSHGESKSEVPSQENNKHAA